MVRRLERVTVLLRLQALFEVVFLAQNRKFQDFVESKYIATGGVATSDVADDAITNAKTDGAAVKYLEAVYDFAVDGGDVGGIPLKDTAGLPLVIPDKAIVINSHIEIETAVTSGGSATVAFGLEGNTDAFKAATGKASLTLDAVFAASNDLPLKMAAPTAVLGTVAVAALTAGKFRIFIKYLEGN